LCGGQRLAHLLHRVLGNALVLPAVGTQHRRFERPGHVNRVLRLEHISFADRAAPRPLGPETQVAAARRFD
jgi:hypothetical protein